MTSLEGRETEKPDTNGPGFLFLCRNDRQTILLDEIAACFKKSGSSFDVRRSAVVRNGAALLAGLGAEARSVLDGNEFVFERQRLPDVFSVRAASIKSCAQSVIQDHFPAVDRSDLPWTLHAFTPDAEEFKPFRPRVKNVEQAILEKLKKRFGRMFRRYQSAQSIGENQDYLVVQLCMDAPDRIYLSISPKTPRINPYPGGERRMSFDPGSPSRSYLKLAEAVSRMPDSPRPGQSTVDLGAAPGGWTYFLLKTGCNVTAVDNGALKIREPAGLAGNLKVVQTDGMRFAPKDDRSFFDWMCCDMLRPPRQTLELLEKWIERSWMKWFVVNMKLPQKNPLTFVREVQDRLAKQNLAYCKIKQLYHDRDEITAMGKLNF